ncbi:hypothetical protein VTI74DRAFT_4539 [Chaetomium olivicolor]
MRFLGNLPAELIEEIGKTLCPHCNPPVREVACFDIIQDTGCSGTQPEDQARASALSSLCLTSRQLNLVATRHLYHRPHCERWWLLSRTLIARQDLAQLVKEMHICYEHGLEHDGQVLFEALEYLKTQFRAHANKLPGKEVLVCLQDVEHHDFLPEEHNLPVEVLTSLCPNLEILHAQVNIGDAFRFCPPHSLLRLRDVGLGHGPRHDDQFGTFLDWVAGLFRAAPNITHLVCQRVDGCDELGLTLKHLTSLEFRASRLDSEGLANVLSMCPNLKMLTYELGYWPGVNPDQFGAVEAATTILENTPNLESFRVDAQDAPWFGSFLDNYKYGWELDARKELKRVLEGRGICVKYYNE